jgi:hypothetical protein
MIAPIDNVFDHIEKRCEEVGVTFYSLMVNHLGKRPEQIHNWKKKDPKSFEIYKEVITKLDELEKRKKC